MKSIIALFSQMPAELPGYPAGGMELISHTGLAILIYLALMAAGVIVDIGLAVRFIGTSSRWPDHTARLVQRPWSPRDGARLAFLLLALYFVGGLLQVVSGKWMTTDTAAHMSFWLVAQSVLFHGIGLVVIVLTMIRRRLSWKDAFGFDHHTILKDLARGVLLYLGTLPFLVFYSLLYQFGLNLMGYEPELPPVMNFLVSGQAAWVRIYLALLAVGIAPLFEELLFRGIGLPLVARRYGVIPAVVVISAIFAMIHFHIPSLVPLFIIAAAFSLGYIYYESILVPIVMHSIFNAVNLVLLFVMT